MLTAAASYFLRGWERIPNPDGTFRTETRCYDGIRVSFRSVPQEIVGTDTLSRLELLVDDEPRSIQFSWIADPRLKHPLDRYNGKFRPCATAVRMVA